ncbi:hypothetical protein ACSBR1_015495 [Camellia fascicularis]
MENIFSFPWSKDSPIVLGPRFKDAFQDPNSYLAIEPIFEKERYIVTNNPSKGNIYALLKDQAKSDDILKAAFHAHVFMRSITDHSVFMRSITDLQSHITESCKMVSALYGPFKSKATEQLGAPFIPGSRLHKSLQAKKKMFQAKREYDGVFFICSCSFTFPSL